MLRGIVVNSKKTINRTTEVYHSFRDRNLRPRKQTESFVFWLHSVSRSLGTCCGLEKGRQDAKRLKPSLMRTGWCSGESKKE